jgi:DNA-binding NarL/FixJ family response regulator
MIKGRELDRFPPALFFGVPMITQAFLIVDDHPLFLEALQTALLASYPHADVEVAESIVGARAKLDGLRAVRASIPKTPLVVISAIGGSEIVGQVRSCGADGFISKNQKRAAIMDSVARLLHGEMQFPDSAVSDAAGDELIDKLRQLTPQQLKVLNRVCEAKLNKQIAFELSVTETTIKAHITLIFKKLGVHSRTQAVLLLQKMRHELEDTEFAVLLSAQA